MSEASVTISGVLGVIVLGTAIAFYAYAVSVAARNPAKPVTITVE